MRLFEIYGIVFASDYPLPGRSVTGIDTQTVMVHFERNALIESVPVHPESQLDGWSNLAGGHWMWRAADGYRYRVGKRFEAHVDPTLRHLRLRAAPGESLDLALTFLSGTFSAFLLILRGQWPFHASAVRWERHGIAVVGSSGMGKSTWAASLCTAGAQLITDDVLVLTRGSHGLFCIPGANTLRLRSDEVGLGKSPVLQKSADGRFLWKPQSVTEPTQLSIVLIPERGSVSEPDLQLIDPIAAVHSLSAYPRILGWADRTIKAQQFRALADIARSVPVFRATLPSHCHPSDLRTVLPALLRRAGASE